MRKGLKFLSDTKNAKPVGDPIPVDRYQYGVPYRITTNQAASIARERDLEIGRDVNAFGLVDGKLYLLWRGPKKGPRPPVKEETVYQIQDRYRDDFGLRPFGSRY